MRTDRIELGQGRSLQRFGTCWIHFDSEGKLVRPASGDEHTVILAAYQDGVAEGAGRVANEACRQIDGLRCRQRREAVRTVRYRLLQSLATGVLAVLIARYFFG